MTPKLLHIDFGLWQPFKGLGLELTKWCAVCAVQQADTPLFGQVSRVCRVESSRVESIVRACVSE
jgi:hypothetical protein